MAEISQFLATELAETWETMAEMEHDSHAARRATLRECADALRMLSNRTVPEPQSCPYSGVMRYCQYRPESVAKCGLGLASCRSWEEAQAHRKARRSAP